MGRRCCGAFVSSRSRMLIKPRCRKRRNCSMASRRALVLAGALVAAVCGCRSVRNVRVDPGQPQELTAYEAQKARADGLALYNQQPRELAVVEHGARLLEQA